MLELLIPEGAMTMVADSTTPWRNRERIHRMYVDQEMSGREIADTFGCDPATVYNWLERHGIERRDNANKKVWNARRQLPQFGLSTNGYERWQTSYMYESEQVYVHRLLAVAEYGFDAVSDMQIHHKNGVKWDNRPDNIVPLATGEHERLHIEEKYGLNPEECLWRDRDWLVEKYHGEGLSLSEMSEEVGVTLSTIRRWMVKYGIEIRPQGSTPQPDLKRLMEGSD